jgi:site-specific DNA recombinase
LRDKSASGQIDKVFIHNPDRLARKHAHQLILIEEFKKLGVEVCFANRSISETPEDQLLLQIQGVISEFEREKIIERNRRGKLHKAKAGKINVLSGAPYGYVYIRKAENMDARYEIHPEEAAVVKEIFSLFILKRMSINAIARQFTSEGLITKSGQHHWSPSVISRMLRNSTYYGQAAYRKKMVNHNIPTSYRQTKQLGYVKRHTNTMQRPRGEWIFIPTPAIIDEDTYRKAQDIIEENKNFSSRNNKKNFYLLSGLLRCKECGYSFYGVTSGNGNGNPLLRWSYYQCAGQNYWRMPDGKVRCYSGNRVRAEVLEQLVWESTKRLIEEPQVIFDEYAQRLQAGNQQQGTIQMGIEKKKKEIRNLSMEKERLLDLYQSGKITKNEIEERLTKLRSKIKATEQEMELLKGDSNERQSELRLIKEFSTFKNEIAERIDKLTNEEKKKMIRLLVKDVIVDRKDHGIMINHIIPAEKLRLSCTRINS